MRRFTIIFAVLGLVGFAGAMNGAWAVKTAKEAVVKCAQGQLIADAIAGGADLITIEGTCTEIVTIAADGITLRGDPSVGGTLLGGIIVEGAQRVVIDDLTIDGSTNSGPLDGVRAQNNAHVTVRNSTIQNHSLSGIEIKSASSGLIEGNTIGNNADYGVMSRLTSHVILRGTAENPTQTITSAAASGIFGAALGCFNVSSCRLLGGNLIQGTGAAAAVSVFSTSELRMQDGLNTITSTQDRAIQAGRLSVLTLRWFVVTGRVEVFSGSHAEIRRRLNREPDPNNPPNIAGVINGDIRVSSGADVNFSSPFLALNGITRQGSVTVNGRLLCFGDQGHVQFGTGSGQTLQIVFPNQAHREGSQCNDFNGNVVLPVFGP